MPFSRDQSQPSSNKVVRMSTTQSSSSHDDNNTRRQTRSVTTEQRGVERGEKGENSDESQTNHYDDYYSCPRVPKERVVGFDNSEKNVHRRSLGSCTDRVAEERPKYGAWKTVDTHQQRKLVDRLAPYKRPHSPDPRFNTWVNHFEYYWQIGVDKKFTRHNLRSSNGIEDPEESSRVRSSRAEREGRSSYNNRAEYHRLLSGRPRTTPGRLTQQASDDKKVTAMDSTNGVDSRVTEGCNSKLSNGRTLDAMTRNYSGSRSERTLNSSRSLPVISGLDRRYMGLQSVDGPQMKDIVSRLSRMTSAYHAKFAPNPHVWIDKSPGAHMVVKRENTIA